MKVRVAVKQSRSSPEVGSVHTFLFIHEKIIFSALNVGRHLDEGAI